MYCFARVWECVLLVGDVGVFVRGTTAILVFWPDTWIARNAMNRYTPKHKCIVIKEVYGLSLPVQWNQALLYIPIIKFRLPLDTSLAVYSRRVVDGLWKACRK